MTYTQYTQMIAKWHREDLLTHLSYICWLSWETDDLPPTEQQNNQMVRAFASRVSSISGALGTNDSEFVPEGTTALDLCKLYLEVDESVSDQAFIAAEREKLRTQWYQSEHLKNFTPHENAIDFAAIGGFMTRSMASQLENLNHTFSSPIRAYTIDLTPLFSPCTVG